MNFTCLVSLQQWFLVPTMVLDTDYDDDGEGVSAIHLVFLCVSIGLIF